MGTSSTSSVYIQVIEDVINKVREEFISNAGPGEGVLTELQGIWELKMMQAGGILGPIERSATAAKFTATGDPTNTVRDLNVPYDGPDEYETPTADLLFPPTPIQTPLPAQTPLPGTMGNSYNIPTGGTPITQNDYPNLDENDASGSQSGRPSPFMQPPSSWLINQRPRLDVNVVYEEAERGAGHQPMTQDFLQLSSGKRKREDFGYIPQQDGAGDVYNYQGVVNEDYNVVNTPAPPEIQAPAQNDALDDDDDDEPLNENDDDDDLDEGDDDEDQNTHHLILTQFDKVTRAKNRWKCSLKDGVMHINNRDILFNKASGEFEF